MAFASSSADLVPNGSNGARDIFVRAYPTPVIRSIDPAVAPWGTSTIVTITGDGFAPLPGVGVYGADVTVAPVTRVSEHELSVTIVVSATAATGERSVTVTNTGTGRGPAAGAILGTCSGCLTIVGLGPGWRA